MSASVFQHKIGDPAGGLLIRQLLLSPPSRLSRLRSSLSTLYRLLFCISNLYSLFSPHSLFPNMRTPSLVCALFATVTVVSGAPFPASGSYSSDVFTVSKPNSPSQPGQDPTVGHAHPRIGIKEIRDALPDHQPQAWTGRTYV